MYELQQFDESHESEERQHSASMPSHIHINSSGPALFEQFRDSITAAQASGNTRHAEQLFRKGLLLTRDESAGNPQHFLFFMAGLCELLDKECRTDELDELLNDNVDHLMQICRQRAS